jgi:hypothetical protein
MVESIQSILMRRDGMTKDEAEDLIEDALEDLRIRLYDELSISELDNFCSEWFGLEPDYMEELLGRV